MRILISISLLLGALTAGSTPTAAQSLVLMVVCDSERPLGPSLSHVQASEAVAIFCSDMTPQNTDFCLGVGELTSRAGTGMTCAAAIHEADGLGFEKIFLDTVVPSSRVPHEAAHVFQQRQTNLQFVMERGDSSVDLIGCNLLPGDEPEATYLQMSDRPGSAADDLSCADAIQQSVDTGAALSAKRSTVLEEGARAAIRNQQGVLALDADFNEGSRAEFVIVRIGQRSMKPN
jgi:hypothetical protein